MAPGRGSLGCIDSPILVAIPTLPISKTATSILSLAGKPVSEHIAAIERGLPSSSLGQIARLLGLPKQRLVAALRFAQRRVSERDRTKARFSLEEAERLLRVLRVHQLARVVFTSDEAVAQWLDAPDPSLGMKTPLDLLATDLGAAKVENLAHAMIHGVPV